MKTMEAMEEGGWKMDNATRLAPNANESKKKKKAKKKPTNSKHVMKGKGRWPKC